MVANVLKLLESKVVITKLAEGVNPIDDSPIIEESFLNHPRILRSLYYLNEYITDEIEQKTTPQRKPTTFVITDEQLANVELPAGKIGNQ